MLRSIQRLLFTMCALWTAGGVAQAAPQTFIAVLDGTPGFESSFSIDFGGGFTETAMISNTQFMLEVDPEASAVGTAQFLSYYQTIESLNLPDPFGGPDPIPTGAITVEILPGTASSGTYDPATGSFTTGETYRIHYEGDLSSFGLVDGFVDLPSQSLGIINNMPGVNRIIQNWEGTYTFPGTSVSLNYVCTVNTLIVPEPASVSVLAGLALLFAARRVIR